MSEFPFKNVIVQFDLPFVLRVVDSIRRETTPEDYEEYISVINRLPVMLRFEKQVRELGGIAIALEDMRGLLSYSKTQVWFDKHYFFSLGISKEWESRTEQFIDLAIAHVNHFINLYRVSAEAFWIRPIKRKDIVIFSFAVNRWDGTVQQYPGLKGMLGTGTGIGKIIPKKTDREIREYLVSGRAHDELSRFFPIVADLFDRGEHWAAVLASCIYFESMLARLIRNYFISRGEKDKAIDRKLEYKNRRSRTITNLIETYVPELTGVDIKDVAHPLGEAYQVWCQKARDLRNTIAHGRSIMISKQQADDCLFAVRNFIIQIQKFINKDKENIQDKGSLL